MTLQSPCGQKREGKSLRRAKRTGGIHEGTFHSGRGNDAYLQYEEYEEHKEIHDAIVSRVLDLQAKFNAGDDSVGMELLMFLEEWLFDHINSVDKRYTRHFQRQGAKTKWLRKFW